jgi:hypothetical protein
MLGDRDSAERCLRLAEKLESSACDTSEADRVRLQEHGLGAD